MADWAREVRNSQPEYRVSSSSTWSASAGGAWERKLDTQSSDWARSSRWSAPTTRNLAGSDFETDREWHASTMRCGEGWASDPQWSQYKRAKPTYTDPEDNTRADAAMPIGTTSKTWSPRADGHQQSRDDDSRLNSSMCSTQWRPRLRAEKDMSSVAGDASERSAATPRLGSTAERDGEALKEWRLRHPRY